MTERFNEILEKASYEKLVQDNVILLKDLKDKYGDLLIHKLSKKELHLIITGERLLDAFARKHNLSAKERRKIECKSGLLEFTYFPLLGFQKRDHEHHLKMYKVQYKFHLKGLGRELKRIPKEDYSGMWKFSDREKQCDCFASYKMLEGKRVTLSISKEENVKIRKKLIKEIAKTKKK